MTSVATSPRSTTSTPCAVTPRMKAVASAGDDSRQSRPTATRRVPTRLAKPAPMRSAASFVDIARVGSPSHVVGLEYGVKSTHVQCPLRRESIGRPHDLECMAQARRQVRWPPLPHLNLTEDARKG